MQLRLGPLMLVACLFASPVAAAKPSPKAKSLPAARAPEPAPPPPVTVSWPGPVEAGSLGFGSSQAEVEAVLGKATRTAAVTGGTKWFYGLSAITFQDGKIIGWSTYDRPLKVNIGVAKPGAGEVALGWTLEQLISVRGTPTAVVPFVPYSAWYYGADAFTLERGKVVLLGVGSPSAEKPRPVLPAAPAPAKGVRAPQSILVTNLATPLPPGADIIREYAENQRAADRKYRGKEIEVAGVVKQIGRLSCGRPYVRLYSVSRPNFTVLCAWDRARAGELTKMSVGDRVRFSATALMDRHGRPWFDVHAWLR